MNTKQWTPVLSVFLATLGSGQAFADSSWHYDEDRDTVVYGYVGTVVSHSTSQSEDDTMTPAGSWYYDRDRDTIVFNGAGSRSDNIRTNPSNEAPVFDFDLAIQDQ
jgi:hypothetical protein